MKKALLITSIAVVSVLIGVVLGLEIARDQLSMKMAEAAICPALKQCRVDLWTSVSQQTEERNLVVILHAQMEEQRMLFDKLAAAKNCDPQVRRAALNQ